MSERDVYADDPVRRAIVERMLVELYGNAYSVLRDGKWLGTFIDRETAERYWRRASQEGER